MSEETKKSSKYNHVEYIDINEDGVLEEVAIVKRWDNGDISYIDIRTLAPIDKSRIKTILANQHADKYDLWELLSQNSLSNGINALDFFHNNYIKILKAKGSVNTSHGAGLDSVGEGGVGNQLGSDFSDPQGAVPEGQEAPGAPGVIK